MRTSKQNAMSLPPNLSLITHNVRTIVGQIGLELVLWTEPDEDDKNESLAIHPDERGAALCYYTPRCNSAFGRIANTKKPMFGKGSNSFYRDFLSSTICLTTQSTYTKAQTKQGARTAINWLPVTRHEPDYVAGRPGTRPHRVPMSDGHGSSWASSASLKEMETKLAALIQHGPNVPGEEVDYQVP